MTQCERRQAAVHFLILDLCLAALYTALSGPLKTIDGNQIAAVLATLMIMWGTANSVTFIGIIFL